MSNLTILRSYASKADLSKLPPTVLFSHNDKTLTIFDAYPKAIFHFLLLPRTQPPFSTFDISSLRSLLKCEKSAAKTLLEQMNEDAQVVVKDIEAEMISRYGFKWDIWLGFHGAPSMEHLHLHIISSDLCSEKLKNKKHYNSFHPKLGFFIHLKDVLEWFDGEDSYFDTMAKLDKKTYETMLKEDLACWNCGSAQKNMPTLKTHLQEEFDTLSTREKAKAERKRKLAKREEAPELEASEASDDADGTKRQKT
ncbi:hypothetical protein ONZ45_g2767 [Pleurotus djamor]|nr:hypothetical protein ONZ45_g2767 [Pleurotus djamor]